jgi:tetraacyldisaccharide 4'-kinase
MRAPEFWTGGTLAAKTFAALLSPCGALYGASVRLRESRARPYRARARVICVGNLTAGGSGKTPVAIALGNLLAGHGNVVFLSRGYGGRLEGPVIVDASRHTARDIGDEPLLLARRHKTIVARDRAAGARLADAIGADYIVMDDGFQNFSLMKDFSLLVLDAEFGFGNGKLIPAGPLREPVRAGMARASAIILTGSGDPVLPPFNGPILRARFVPENLEGMRGRKVMAFAGIGRPGKFFSMLVANGVELIGARAFPDHHIFTGRELAGLKKQAADSAALLVTTEKDYVRLDSAQRDGIEPIAIHASFDGSLIESIFARSMESAIAR